MNQAPDPGKADPERIRPGVEHARVRSRRNTVAQDAIALLEADHQRVEDLFRDFKSAGGDPAARLHLAQIIRMELTLHSMVEEEVFYPALARWSTSKWSAGTSSRRRRPAAWSCPRWAAPIQSRRAEVATNVQEP